MVCSFCSNMESRVVADLALIRIGEGFGASKGTVKRLASVRLDGGSRDNLRSATVRMLGETSSELFPLKKAAGAPHLIAVDKK